MRSTQSAAVAKSDAIGVEPPTGMDKIPPCGRVAVALEAADGAGVSEDDKAVAFETAS